MRQHGSVFTFFVRSSIYKLLWILGIMVFAEGIWFYRTVQEMLQRKQTAGELVVMTPELIFDEANLMVFFAVAMVILAALLVCVGRNTTGHQEYTLYRLSVSPKSVFVWQTVCNSCCLLLLWFIQVLFAYGLCMYYIAIAEGTAITHQSLFLAFYRSSFLHGLLPLQDFWCGIRNVLFFCALGSALAYDVYCSRRGKNRMWTWWILLYFGLSHFQVDLTEYASSCVTEITVYSGVLVWIGCITLAGGVWKLDEAASKK